MNPYSLCLWFNEHILFRNKSFLFPGPEKKTCFMPIIDYSVHEGSLLLLTLWHITESVYGLSGCTDEHYYCWHCVLHDQVCGSSLGIYTGALNILISLCGRTSGGWPSEDKSSQLFCPSTLNCLLRAWVEVEVGGLMSACQDTVRTLSQGSPGQTKVPNNKSIPQMTLRDCVSLSLYLSHSLSLSLSVSLSVSLSLYVWQLEGMTTSGGWWFLKWGRKDCKLGGHWQLKLFQGVLVWTTK